LSNTTAPFARPSRLLYTLKLYGHRAPHFLQAPALLPSLLAILLLDAQYLKLTHPHSAAQAIMSLVLDSAGPPPHLLQSRAVSWPCPFDSHQYPASTSSPAPMSPRSLQSYMSHIPESPLPSQEANTLPTSSWYGPSISAPECLNHVSLAYFAKSCHSRLIPRVATPHIANMCLRIQRQSHFRPQLPPTTT
jgi:hypothetical protein